MKRILLFIFFTIILINLNAQKLVSWNNADFSPTISNNKINADNITASMNIDNLNWDGLFFSTAGWPTPNYNNTSLDTFDNNKYIQLAIKPVTGQKIKLSEFGFNYRLQGGKGRMKINYSYNANFSDAKILLSPIDINNEWSDVKIINFPTLPEQIIPDGKKMYIRIYVANTENNFFIRYFKDKNIGPYINGETSQDKPTAPITIDDVATTLKNNEVAINVLENDAYDGKVTLKVASQPQNGIVTVDSNNKVIYTPKANFVGEDVFYYTVTNNQGTSRLTKVTVKVTNEANIGLIRWNNDDFTGSPLNSAIAKTGLRASELVLKKDSWETPIYDLSNLGGNENLNENKYLEFVVDNISETKNITLNSFAFDYRGTSPAVYTIKYSKDPNFKTDVRTLASDISADINYVNKAFNFNGFVLKSTEKLYIRLYVYKTWSQFVIQYNNNIERTIQGPLLTGIVENNYITTWMPELYWDNGVPNAYKTAIIKGVYNTKSNGAFVTADLIVRKEGSLTISPSANVKVYNKITNEGDGSNFTIESDADLIQVSNTTNEGKITVKRSTRLPKMGYNYWASPVKGQNLYQFSDGYDTSTKPINPQGTPWSNFYVYNEATNYFVTNIPNEIKLDARAEFQTGRGYAIRGKNSFPSALTMTSPSTEFSFVGVPNNGDLFSQPLKYTDADHTFNMVGNPYPSNLDMDMFFEVNKDNIEPLAYFWTNNDMSILYQQGSNYKGNNYAIYNKVGGISATFKGINKAKPNEASRVAQGFIVQAKATGKNKALSFTNEMRTSDQGVFFNNRKALKDRFWINLNSPSDINNEILVSYLPDATNGIDGDYDTELLVIGNDAIWTEESNRKLGIQARDLSQLESDIVKLGLKFSENGNYTISISDKEGRFNNDQPIYLKDKLNSKIIEITKEDYTFYAEKGTGEDRFTMVYQNEKTLSTDDSAKNKTEIYQQKDNVFIKSNEKIINIELYDALGRTVYNKKPNSKELTISTAAYNPGLYVIKVQTTSGITTKKILK